jgi:sialic acid synthase SpsE
MERARVALGDGRKRCLPAEAPNVVPSRRALYARRPMRAGDCITDADVVVLRPGSGLAPSMLPALIGSVLARDVAAGAPFELADVTVEKAS